MKRARKKWARSLGAITAIGALTIPTIGPARISSAAAAVADGYVFDCGAIGRWTSSLQTLVHDARVSGTGRGDAAQLLARFATAADDLNEGIEKGAPSAGRIAVTQDFRDGLQAFQEATADLSDVAQSLPPGDEIGFDTALIALVLDPAGGFRAKANELIGDPLTLGRLASNAEMNQVIDAYDPNIARFYLRGQVRKKVRANLAARKGPLVEHVLACDRAAQGLDAMVNLVGFIDELRAKFAHHEPVGELDGISLNGAGQVVARGWAVDLDEGGTDDPGDERSGPIVVAVDVDLLVDGAVVATGKADAPRKTILDRLHGRTSSYVGFELSAPLGSGQHQVCVSARSLHRMTTVLDDIGPDPKYDDGENRIRGELQNMLKKRYPEVVINNPHEASIGACQTLKVP